MVDALRQPGLEVLRHDISVDDLPPGRFDLVHARLLLSRLGNRDVVMTKLIGALKPGGWLLAEDYAHLTLGFVDPADLFDLRADRGAAADSLVLKALAANAEAGFAQFIYGMTGPLVAPFLGLFSTPQTASVATLELYTLIAGVIYALVAWLLAKGAWLVFGEGRSASAARTDTDGRASASGDVSSDVGGDLSPTQPQRRTPTMFAGHNTDSDHLSA